MKCPVCSNELRMTERQGVEIDYCAQCRGVWLDRGELDKIIERSSTEMAPAEREDYRTSPRRDDPSGYRSPEHRHDPRYHDPRYKKKKSFLGELFDFD